MSRGIFVELGYGQEKVQGTVQHHPLDTPGLMPDGRLFRYCFSDGAVVAGHLLQTKVPVADDDMDVVVAAAAAIAAKSISITTVSAILVDEYKDGFLYVNDGPGEGQCFRLGSHLAAGAAATLVLNLATDEEVITALTTASLVGLKWNKAKDVIDFPTTPTGVPVGVTPMDVSDNRYFWAQVQGDAAVLIEDTVVLGKGVIPGTTTAGSVKAQVDAGGDDPVIGWVNSPIAVTTDYGHITLCIPL